MPNTTGQNTVGSNEAPAEAVAESGSVFIELFNDGTLASYGVADIEAQLVTQAAVTREGTALAAGSFKLTDVSVDLKPQNGDIADVISGATQITTTADAEVTNNGSKRNLDAGGAAEDYHPEADLNILPATGSGVVLAVSYELI